MSVGGEGSEIGDKKNELDFVNASIQHQATQKEYQSA